jgi:hypothetical protein
VGDRITIVPTKSRLRVRIENHDFSCNLIECNQKLKSNSELVTPALQGTS